MQFSGRRQPWPRHQQFAPDIPFLSDSLTLSANRGYYCRFIPEDDGVVSGVGFMMHVAGGTADTCNVGIGDIDPANAEFRRLSQSTDRANFLAAAIDPLFTGGTAIPLTGLFQHPMAFPRQPVRQGRPHYAFLRPASVSQQVVSAKLGREAMAESTMAQQVPGLMAGMELAGVVPAAMTTRPTRSYEVPLLIVSYQRRVVCMGDSITNPSPTDMPWTRILAQLLGPNALVINKGIGGESIANMNSRAARDITQERPLDVVILAGINDVQAGRTTGQIQADMTTLLATVTAIGAKPWICTILPWGSYAFYSGANETTRLAVNNWIRAGAGGGHAFIDAEAAMTASPGPPPTLLDSADGLHPGYTGQEVLGRTIFSQSFKVPAARLRAT